jgi:adenine-specific DNA-methyltransferase
MPISLPPTSCKVYTPDDLATALVEAVGDVPSARWLEPSHGQGAFLRAIAALGVGKQRVTAIDLDQTQSDSDCLARTARGVDFLKWSRLTENVFDRIVGNPPYVAIRRLPPDLQQMAASVRGPDGKPIGIGGNLWQAFVLASLRILAPGGSLGFVLPSAAEFADYSTELREVVRDQFDVLELYRCRRPLFDQVQEGTVVVIARGFGGGPCRFRRREVATREALIGEIQRRPQVRRSRCPIRSRSISRASTTFGDFATVRLGGVTGDAKFFLLTESERKAAGLPSQACIPVVSRSRHVKSASIDLHAWRRLRDRDERVWLFNPTDEVIEDPAVQRRLNLDPSAGGCNRSAFKVAVRDPWYRTPMPRAPDAFISGMQSQGPWLTLNMMPNLNATNTLYVVNFADTVSDKERFAIALGFLTTKVRKQLVRKARRYADGLWKYEPGTLRTISLPEISSCDDYRNLYFRAMDALLKGDAVTAQRIADSGFANLRVSPTVRITSA